MKKNPGGIIILNMITINENHMMYDSWDMEHDKYFFLILDHFLPFYTPVPPNNPENQNFEKMKKATGDVIILHKCTINNNHMIYGSYEMWSAPDRFFFCHLGPFFALSPPNSLKIEHFKKMKKSPGGITILLKYTKNHDRRLYCSWDMACDGCNYYFSFGHFFPPFTPPLTAQKIKKFKKNEKKPWRYNHLTQVYQKLWSRALLFLRWRMTDVIIFHFGPFLPFYPHNGPKNENFKKMKKTLGDIIILHNRTKNHDRMLYCSWDMACDGCNCYFYFGLLLAIYPPPTAEKIKIPKERKKPWRYHFTHVYQKLWLDDVRFRMDRRTDGKSDI